MWPRESHFWDYRRRQMAIDDRTQSSDRHGKRRDEIDVDSCVMDKVK